MGDLSIVKLLADKDAEINAENSDGMTALHKASVNGHTQVVLNLANNYFYFTETSIMVKLICAN